MVSFGNLESSLDGGAGIAAALDRPHDDAEVARRTDMDLDELQALQEEEMLHAANGALASVDAQTAADKESAVKAGDDAAAAAVVATAAPSLGHHECSVCLEEKELVVIAPCGHKSVCFDCFSAIKNDGDGECPICRRPMDSFILAVYEPCTHKRSALV